MQVWTTTYGVSVNQKFTDGSAMEGMSDVVLLERENAKMAHEDNNLTFERWVEFSDFDTGLMSIILRGFIFGVDYEGGDKTSRTDCLVYIDEKIEELKQEYSGFFEIEGLDNWKIENPFVFGANR